jgi:hypothetical protein
MEDMDEVIPQEPVHADDDDDVYSDMPELVSVWELSHAPFGLVALWQNVMIQVVQDEEDIDAVQALRFVAQQQQDAEEHAIADGDADYISGEEFVKGGFGFVLDDCKTSPILEDTLRRLVEERGEGKKHLNPLTQQPIRAIRKV